MRSAVEFSFFPLCSQIDSLDGTLHGLGPKCWSNPVFEGMDSTRCTSYSSHRATGPVGLLKAVSVSEHQADQLRATRAIGPGPLAQLLFEPVGGPFAVAVGAFREQPVVQYKSVRADISQDRSVVVDLFVGAVPMVDSPDARR